MSSTNRGSKIQTNEFYPTPINVTEPMLANIDFGMVYQACEPAVGDGAISRDQSVLRWLDAEG